MYAFLSSSIASYFSLTPHPFKAEEWLYFHKGQARATVFLGGAIARTFDFTAGDTAVFPDNSGNFSHPSQIFINPTCKTLVSFILMILLGT